MASPPEVAPRAAPAEQMEAPEEAEEAEAPPAADAFAEGRFAIELPWPPRFEVDGGVFRATHDGDGVTSLSYQDLGPGPAQVGTAPLFDAAQRAAGQGERLAPGRLDHWIAQRHDRREGAVHHAVVAWLADETVFVLEGRGGRGVVQQVEDVAGTFRVVRASGGVDQSRTDVGEEDIGTAPVATAREAARAPRSSRPGAESFGASCNTIASNGSCDEFEPGLAAEPVCGAMGTFSDRLPCPNEGRLVSCLMRDARLARHWYEPNNQAELICQRVGGELHTDRVFPRRPAAP